ncbi:MAG: Uma2 family endonuclease [Crocosphaera sp.]
MIQVSEKIYNFEDYCQYNDQSDNHYELVDGRLVLMNPPTVRHFLLAKFLEMTFDQLIEKNALPLICFRDAGVRTGWRKSRLPDVFITTKESASELLDQSAIFQIPPLLIVEIVSPESVTRDYRYKRSEYAALGVDEYWIVDPKNETIMILLLEEGLYEERIYNLSDKLVSRLFSELNLTVNQVLVSGNM